MEDINILHKLERRSFLKVASAAGVAGLIEPKKLLSNTLENSRVIIIEDSNATNGNNINADVVQIMIDEGIKSLVQLSDVGQAWKSLLSGIQATSKIALKVNCINSSMSTHPALTNAVSNSLKNMRFSGNPYNENNIIIYDRTSWELRNAGYTINTGTTGVRCISTDTSGVGYTTESYNCSGSNQKISKIVTEMVDYLINLAILKNHSGAGVTLCLKNHLGTCDNPGGLHGNNCNPYTAALNAIDPIRSKQKIFIIDALWGVRSGGPGGSPQFTPNKIIMSADIVATDYQGRKLLADNGCQTTNYANHIDTAATTYNLGTNNPAQMDIINIKNPSQIQASITVLTPNGGETWQGGTSKYITWKSNDVKNVKIEYSTDNGNSWVNLATSVSAVSASDEWIVSDTPSKQCKIKISDTANSNTKDESDNVFTITAALKPQIKIVSPNGGESWQAGSQHDITWTAQDVGNLAIEYSTDNGNSWKTIAPSVGLDSSPYKWDLPDKPSDKCKIRIYNIDDPSTYDSSDAVFTITRKPQPQITIIAPNGGEAWQSGTAHDVIWTGQDVANVKIDLSIDDGNNWQSLTQSVPVNSSPFQFNIPDTPSDQCKVRVSDVTNETIFDESDGLFTITRQPKPEIMVLSPDGGENWEANSIHEITWEYLDVDTVNIYYSINNGTNWNEIIRAILAESSPYKWKIPNTISSNCIVKVTDADDEKIYDTSNAVFSISPETDVSDNENKNFVLFQNYPNPVNQFTDISFRLSEPANVKLDLLNAEGKQVQTIEKGYMGSGLNNIKLDCSKYPPGVYFYRIRVNGKMEMKKMVVE